MTVFYKTETVVVVCLWQIERLEVPMVAAQRSFIWIWCGNAEGLERGRKVTNPGLYHWCDKREPVPAVVVQAIGLYHPMINIDFVC